MNADATFDDWEEAREERSAIMEHEGGASREQADTWRQEWLMECLARWVWERAKHEGRALAEEFLTNYGRIHGADAERRPRNRVNEVRNG